MPTRTARQSFRRMAALVAACLWVVAASAQNADELMQQAEKAYRDAEKSFFSGQVADAGAGLSAVGELTAKARAAGASASRLTALENRAKALADKVARRAAGGTTGGGAAAPAPAAAPAADKIPSGVTYRLREADRALQKGERQFSEASANLSTDYRVQSARAAAADAQAALDEIARTFAGQYSESHPDLVAMRARIAAVEQKAAGLSSGAAQQAAAQAAGAAAAEQASAPWVARLAPFAAGPGSPGHDAKQYVIGSATMEADEMNRRARVYGEAKASLNELKAAALPARTEALEKLVSDLESELKAFEESVRSYAGQALDDAETRLGQMESFLTEQAGKAERKESFTYLQKDQLQDAGRRVEWAARLAATGETRVAAARARLARAADADAALRRRRVAETRMRADAFAGPEQAAIRRQAEAIAAKDFPGAQVLRITVPGAAWVQESVLEYTDTTRTALRHRTTRSVTAQAAVRDGAETRLLTLDIASDLQAGGAWGPLHGHVMFKDAILPENVNK